MASQLNSIPISVGVRKVEAVQSPAYGKYYIEVLNNRTISTRALLEHIMSHGLGFPRAIVQAASEASSKSTVSRLYIKCKRRAGMFHRMSGMSCWMYGRDQSFS